MGVKGKEIDGYKIWYSGSIKAKNGVGILVEKELVDFVVRVRCKSDRIITIKVLVGSEFVNVVSIHAPQIGLLDDIKKLFWEDLDMVILVLTQLGMIRSTGA